MSEIPRDPKAAWDEFIAGLQSAVERMDELTTGLSERERADGFQVLARTLGVQLEAMEMDRIRPVPIPHNTWQTKFLMDNPDGRYWTFEIDPTQAYLITGNVGGAAYTAVNVYVQRKRWHDTAESASIHDGEMKIGEDGDFSLKLGGDRDGTQNWLPLADDARTVWLRQFYHDVYADRPSSFQIKNILQPGPPSLIDPSLLAERLAIGGKKLRSTTSAIRHAGANELVQGNYIRTWSEMQSGAVFTSSDIWYQRGGWQLGANEALVLEGVSVPSKFWNIVLYSRFLNSLEHRYRPVSLTNHKIETAASGAYRLVIAHTDPGCANWLDTEGRPAGLFALRWVFPASEPPLPKARVLTLDELRTSAEDN
jgi:hypothetical protein